MGSRKAHPAIRRPYVLRPARSGPHIPPRSPRPSVALIAGEGSRDPAAPPPAGDPPAHPAPPSPPHPLGAARPRSADRTPRPALWRHPVSLERVPPPVPAGHGAALVSRPGAAHVDLHAVPAPRPAAQRPRPRGAGPAAGAREPRVGIQPHP